MDVDTLCANLREGTNLKECFLFMSKTADPDVIDNIRFTDMHNRVFMCKVGIKIILNVIEDYAGTCGSAHAAWVMVQRQADAGFYHLTAYALSKALKVDMSVCIFHLRLAIRDWMHAVDRDPLGSVPLPNLAEVNNMLHNMQHVDKKVAKFLRRRIMAMQAPRPVEDIQHLRVFPEFDNTNEADAFWGEGKFGHDCAKAFMHLCMDMAHEDMSGKRRRFTDTGEPALRAIGKWVFQHEAYLESIAEENVAKIVLVAVGMLTLVLFVGFMMNTVAVPATNLVWSKRGHKRCTADPTASKYIVVFLPCFGKTALDESKAQLKRLFTTASCPFRVRAVLVVQGEDHVEMMDVMKSIEKGLMFKGAHNFVVSEHVSVVDGGPQCTGTLAAFALGVSQQLQDADYAMLLAPCGETRAKWDRTLLEDLQATPAPQTTVLTYAHNKAMMQNVTYPLLSTHNGMPMVTWTQFASKPAECFPSKALSSDFAFVPGDILRTPAGKQFVSLLQNQQLACPPSFFGVLCAGLLWNADVTLRAPRSLVTNPVASLGMNNYRQVLRSETGRAMNTSTTNVVLQTLMQQFVGGKFENAVLGTNLASDTNTVSGIMGVMPDASDAEIQAKYGTKEEFERQLAAIRNMGTV